MREVIKTGFTDILKVIIIFFATLQNIRKQAKIMRSTESFTAAGACGYVRFLCFWKRWIMKSTRMQNRNTDLNCRKLKAF